MEIILKGLSRRSLIGGVGICSVLPLICGRDAGTSDAIQHSPIILDDELRHGCLFATTSGQCFPDDQAVSVDLWSFRVSEIDSSSLPASVGRTVIWDDVFSLRSLTRSVGAALSAVTEWYEFDPCVGQFSFHLDGHGHIGLHVRAINSQREASASLALIDISSCGLSRIDWPDILPHARESYDGVVGFAHWSSYGPVSCETVAGNPRIRKALAYCDQFFWTDDKMLGLDEEACCNARSPPLNSVVQDLVRALSAKGFSLGLEKIARDGSLFEGRLRIAPQAIALGMS
ncbi:hypothetical protein XH88_26220 [Bradyrhizobium sp. CCBAU 51627]|nr:hypothetical protein [Bradyrhizobium sp. CCBAU 51627]